MNTDKPILSNGTYDKAKATALLILPAIGVLYFAIAQIWGLPNPEEVLGTVVALETFLGALVGISSKQYNELDESDDYV